ncbi:MAG TPA: tyrosine-type recombinase/integrase [Sphingomicrobium sp.]|nr:tyrosine-type recombinase/integrase [Sphingomicrobium sp.]
MLTAAKVAAIKPPAKGQEEHRDSKVTGLRLRVGAGGKKTWIVRARAGAKILNKKLGTYPAMKLAAARTAAERLLEAIARDGTAEAVDRTFGAVADAWIDKVAKPKNDSWQQQKRRLEMHIFPAWRDRRIADIRRADVRELVEGIEGEVLPNRVLTIIKTVFRFALSRDWLEASPAEGIEKPNAESERDRVLDMAELKRVWDAAGLIGFPFGQFVRMLALTGQRRTEVATMRWADVDLEAATWTLSKADTKSDRKHLVPLPEPAVELLKGLPRFDGYVFTTDGETHISGFAKGKARLDAFIAGSGDPVEPWTLHDLRRSAATHMVRLGVLEEVVGRVLNHAPKGVTAKVYALHTYAPEKRSALDRWAAELMRAVEGKPAEKVVPIRG